MVVTLLLITAVALAAGNAVILWRRLRTVRREVEALRRATKELSPAAHALSAGAEWLALPVRGAQDALWDWDVIEDRIRFSARWREMIGLPAEEIIANAEEWRGRVHPVDRAQLEVDFAAQSVSGATHFRSEHRVHHHNGEWLMLQWTGIIVRDDTGRAIRVAGSVRDTTALRTVEEQARRDAFYDALTGLPNRALGHDLLRRAIARTRRQGERRFAALHVSIDRFTLLNDSLGQGAGDEIVRGVARRLATAIRPGDVIARLGNDAYLVILDAVSETSEADRIADRIHLVLRDPIPVLAQELVVSTSVGVALHSPDNEVADEYLRNAELALAAAQDLGGGRTAFYAPSMREGARHRVSLEQDLHTAITHHQLVVWYQPVFVSSDAGERLVGFEALVRWNHPERGLLGPGEFIPIAEETGAIVPLGTWVLQEACRHIAGLGAGRTDAPWVSVNVAERQITEGTLVEVVEDALERAGLEPHRLRLEVTENSILPDEEGARATLEALRERGVKILMDDFGTGHASLSYLHRLPIASIKIDRYFVGRMDVSAECREIVKSVIALAKSLSMDVVAEGVEQEVQLQALRAMGCDHVQGFLLSHPVRAEDTHGFLTTELAAAS